MSTCTYEGCRSAGTTPHRGDDGTIWANLCAEHTAKMKAAVDSCDVRRILGTWVKAQGGAKAAAARM